MSDKLTPDSTTVAAPAEAGQTRQNERVRFVNCVVCGSSHHETSKSGNKLLVCGACNTRFGIEVADRVQAGQPAVTKVVWVLEQIANVEKLDRELNEARRTLNGKNREFEQALAATGEFSDLAEAVAKLKIANDAGHEHTKKLLVKESGGQQLDRAVYSVLYKRVRHGDAVRRIFSNAGGTDALQAIRDAARTARATEQGRKLWREIGGQDAFRALKAAERRLVVRRELEVKVAEQAKGNESSDPDDSPAVEVVATEQVETVVEAPQAEAPKPKARRTDATSEEAKPKRASRRKKDDEPAPVEEQLEAAADSDDVAEASGPTTEAVHVESDGTARLEDRLDPETVARLKALEA